VNVPNHEAHCEQLPDRQHVERPRERHRRENERASDVGGDQQRAAPHPVDPDPRRQREEEKRRVLERRPSSATSNGVASSDTIRRERHRQQG
jgi:hypothetical protein